MSKDVDSGRLPQPETENSLGQFGWWYAPFFTGWDKKPYIEQGRHPPIKEKQRSLRQANIFGYIAHLAHRSKNWFDVLAEKVSAQYINNPQFTFGVVLEKLGEAEILRVEGVDHFAHCFHTADEIGPEAAQLFGGEVVFDEGFTNGVGGHFSRLERQIDP